jgi:hypothetical protein
MRNFKEVLEDLTTATKNAAIDLDSVPTKFRTGMAICKADAISSLKTLREEYRTVLSPRVAAIWLTGDLEKQKKFAALAKEEGETLTVSTMAAYEKMAEDIEPTIGFERQFGGTQLGHLLRSLENVAREGGATFLATPKLFEVVTVPDIAALAVAIKGIIATQVGETVNALYMEKQILDQALEARYGEKVVPIVVLTGQAAESHDLRHGVFGGRGMDFDIPDDKDPDKEMVLAVFASLQKSLKKQ